MELLNNQYQKVRQTDGEMDRQKTGTERWTDRQTDEDRQIDADRQTNRCRQTNRLTDRQTD